MGLDELRKKIDALDHDLLALLNKRAAVVKKVGEFKAKTGQDFYIPHREKKIISGLIKENRGPLNPSGVEAIYREILNACRSLESRIKVAYFGPEATFTHQAALKNFGSSADYIACGSITDVFAEVEKERADYGVVPIENSTEGAVNHTLDMFIESDLVICAELNMRIELCLMSVSGRLGDIKKVYSFRQPLAQSRGWLEKHLPGIPVIEKASTAEASKCAAREKDSAAVASKAAATLYNLEIVERGIEDSTENYTRFLVIGRTPAQVSGQDKTSIMFSIRDRVGALYDMLIAFKKNNINLTKIESRPTKRRAWEYIFFIDFSGHVGEARVQKVLKELAKNCIMLKVLGSYPRAE